MKHLNREETVNGSKNITEKDNMKRGVNVKANVWKVEPNTSSEAQRHEV